MTAADLVDKLLASEHGDVLRDSVAWLVAEVMETEIGELTGAGLGERAPERRQASATATAHDAGTPALASWSWRSPSCARAAASRRCWSRAGVPSRPWSPCSSLRQDRHQEVAQLIAF